VHWRTCISVNPLIIWVIIMKLPILITTPVPMPSDWAKVHDALTKAWIIRSDNTVPKPPTPLILAGAAFSTAGEIRSRWIDLIKWSNEFGFAEILLNNLGFAPDVDVAEQIAGVKDAGRGHPVLGDQFQQTKLKPTNEAVRIALDLLVQDWAEIVGEELAGFTKPRKFTGHKCRRLVVSADPEYVPPWGRWHSASKNPESFTKFRRAVNNAISPLEVDVIDFV